ncbi:uncharacterized protein LOC116591992 [Mustela erminea]|uniref:uncharacterized protein LOC116591992 n=1 Tax=Mustela erminea TaxID=36723 RepID=UPI0013869576|nr:uncharacterized protein LOC116591992 [Mustela erminea]
MRSLDRNAYPPSSSDPQGEQLDLEGRASCLPAGSWSVVCRRHGPSARLAGLSRTGRNDDEDARSAQELVSIAWKLRTVSLRAGPQQPSDRKQERVHRFNCSEWMPLLQRNVTARSARETNSEVLWPWWGGAPDRKLPSTGTDAAVPAGSTCCPRRGESDGAEENRTDGDPGYFRNTAQLSANGGGRRVMGKQTLPLERPPSSGLPLHHPLSQPQNTEMPSVGG